MDIAQDEWVTQVVCNFGRINALGGERKSAFREFYHLVRRGDYICMAFMSTLNGVLLINCSCLWESICYPNGRIVCQYSRAA
jgi:hypothetical protein